MAALGHTLLFSAILIALISPGIHGQVEETGLKMMGDTLQWPLAMSMYADLEEKGEYDNESMDSDGEDGDEEMGGRRSLFWGRVHYYISYGALSANRIPCPPRSGRSYYTHNCFNSGAPANPYTRGCSRITRCRR